MIDNVYISLFLITKLHGKEINIYSPSSHCFGLGDEFHYLFECAEFIHDRAI
jgi:hypothetical protein